LKMMLGLSAQDGAAQSDYAEQDSAPVPKANEKRTSKASSKNSQQRASKEVQPLSDPSSTASAKNAPPAWGGAAVIQPVTKKSMSEIQKEEERVAALNAKHQQGGRPSSSGWANVAASRGGSSAWSGAAAKQPAAAVVTKPNAMAPTGIPTRSKAKVAAVEMEPSTPSQSQRSSSSSVAEEFGAKMSPLLEKWCKDQMQILNGTDDLTLVSFCMSLNNPEEIRQYLTTYLGSTPAVNKFATEFINRKGGTKIQQEEWETSATTKKVRKKKAGGR
jgi:PERQ amino acid-rich with GYF domain-containing protein